MLGRLLAVFAAWRTARGLPHKPGQPAEALGDFPPVGRNAAGGRAVGQPFGVLGKVAELRVAHALINAKRGGEAMLHSAILFHEQVKLLVSTQGITIRVKCRYEFPRMRYPVARRVPIAEHCAVNRNPTAKRAFMKMTLQAAIRRDLAKQAASTATNMNDPQFRISMLTIAARHAAMARRAEALAEHDEKPARYNSESCR